MDQGGCARVTIALYFHDCLYFGRHYARSKWMQVHINT